MVWFVVTLAVCLLAGSGLLAAARRRWRQRARWTAAALGLPGLLLTGLGMSPVAWLILSVSGDRSHRTLELTPNIAYERQFVDSAVVHWATVDLDALDTCVEVSASVPDDEGLIDASTGTEFGNASGSDLAVNVAFFYPIREYPHWSSYPRSGDPITAIGHVVLDGTRHGVESEWESYLLIDTDDGTASVGSLDDDASGRRSLFAQPGRHRIVAAGRVPDSPEVASSDRYPRTVAGVDTDENTLVLAVVDGKQLGYSRGLSLAAVSRLMIERGVDDAVEFDGGGSATMVGRIDDEVELLSRPSHTRIPGRERPVATFLGFTDNC